jgi:hypothetical protein
MAAGIETTALDLAKITSSLAATRVMHSSPETIERISSMDFLLMSFIFGNSRTA